MTYISVIVPFFNQEKFIKSCILGLLAQTYPRDRYEIIMVDNNSTDASATIVQQYPSIKLLKQKSQGAYSVRNLALTEAKGDIIAFTDPDCVPSSDWLQNITQVMAFSKVNIVLGSRHSPNGSLPLSLMVAYENMKDEVVFNGDIKEFYYGHTNNIAVRRNLFDALGPFLDRPRGSDAIFVNRAVNKFSCELVYYSRKISVRHLELNNLLNTTRRSLFMDEVTSYIAIPSH